MEISDLSIQILNDNYFQFELLSQVKSFKKDFNSLFDEYIGSKNHQLYAVKGEIEDWRLKLEEVDGIEPNLRGVDYSKLNDLVENAQNTIKTFIDNKFASLKANMEKSASVYENGIMSTLRKIIDGDNNIKLYQEYENYLIQHDYLDKKSLRWIHESGKSSFMRFYSKCEEHGLIRERNRSKQIRILSDAYKIDRVDQFDYSKGRCQKALSKKPNEFEYLNVIKSQFNLKLKKN